MFWSSDPLSLRNSDNLGPGSKEDIGWGKATDKSGEAYFRKFLRFRGVCILKCRVLRPTS